jgi:DNA polymerase-1
MCWRLFYSRNGGLRNLSHGDMKTGILFGFLRDLLSLQSDIQTKNVAFCFDAKRLIRKEIYPKYKSSREEKKKAMPQAEAEAVQEMYKQIRRLRLFLPDCGFRNVFYEDGYEADDLVASVVESNPKKELVLVSGDKDLWQLLRPGVSIFLPGDKTTLTAEQFTRDWQLEPKQWAIVKAIAGCGSDDVKGCDGVAEITAAKFLKRTLGKKTNAYKNIKAFRDTAKANMKLVRLPFKGCPALPLMKDEIDPEQWSRVLSRYGIKSLRLNPPRLGERHGKRSQ